MKDRYRSLFEMTTAIFLRYNFYALYSAENGNTDEFDSEVSLIISKLHHCNSESDVMSLIHQIFSKMFSERMAGEPRHFKEPAKELWTAWKESGIHNG